MSGGDVAAVIVAVAVVIVAVGMVIVLYSASRTITTARRAVEDVHQAAVPLLADAHLAVRKATVDLERVDALLTTAESIAGTVDSATRLAHNAVGSPVVKVIATGAGVAKAWRRFKRP